MRYMIAADTGGTFTDIAVYDREEGKVLYGKTLTNYGDLVDGVLEGLADTGAASSGAQLFKHGTTHVINTLIERTGARTALVTTRGFRDSLEIGRGNRPVPFSLRYRRKDPLVPRPLRFEVEERMDASGVAVRPLDHEGLARVADELRELGVEAVAVSFINAYANPVHEEQARQLLQAALPGVFVTAGTTLTREWFEYERTSTAAANAYVGSRMDSYLQRFGEKLRADGFAGTFYMMGSNGGVLSQERARAQPVALVESGPIGGCIGAAAYARALGIERMIAFDMGGTTAKCAVVRDGRFEVQPIYYVDGYEQGYPLKTPVLDIVEVGMGGGSIAAVDVHGRLAVGPRSAGSEPGPVAFGRGGQEPTVTDANLALGRIGGGAFMKGKLSLDTAGARAAIEARVATPLGYDGAEAVDRAAQGILDIAVTSMGSAVKEITIERGFDARDFVLFVFGGGGALFGSQLARQLRIPEVIVPPQPGNFSTLGMLMAGARIDLARMALGEVDAATLARVDEVLVELEQEAREALAQATSAGELRLERALEMRFRGQKHTVRVPYTPGAAAEAVHATFCEHYLRRFGHANAADPVEILEVRLGAEADVDRPAIERLMGVAAATSAPVPRRREVSFPQPCGRVEVDVWDRQALPIGFRVTGPCIVEEFSSTTVLLPGDVATVGQLGELRIRHDAADAKQGGLQ